MCARAASTTSSSVLPRSTFRTPAKPAPAKAGGIIAQSTGRFVLGADDQRERDVIIERFGMTEGSARIVRHRLTGPRRRAVPGDFARRRGAL